MDGLPQILESQHLTGSQRTLKTAIDCVGVGLHSGTKSRLTLSPAAPGSGIVFRRADLPLSPAIPARFDHVIDTRLCTTLGLPECPQVRIGTVEHVMAALAGAGVDNAVVSVDGPEVPILDGSAASFLFLIDCAGLSLQDQPGEEIEVLRPVRVEADAAFAELRPHADSSGEGLDLALSIDFAAPAIGRQALSLHLSPAAFRTELARARTFVQADEIARLHEGGLARGGSLDNAVVVDEARVLNPGGLRMRDEFVRHKTLDAVGDLVLAGARLRGHFIGHCSGHALNNRLLRTLFADARNWRRTGALDRLVKPVVLRGEQLRAA